MSLTTQTAKVNTIWNIHKNYFTNVSYSREGSARPQEGDASPQEGSGCLPELPKTEETPLSKRLIFC